ncbi:MAG: zinc-dependent metalloprotease [Acidimicrobiia bacterium]|nr:zinc-dependent metalloprotease [Acidimicrobiia bacterium]
MSDDIFSKLFELFDQPGPINWKLAAEVAKSVSGERSPIEPWASEEYRELARLAEYRLEQISPFRAAPAAEVLPVDARTWVETHLEHYGNVVEPFSSSVAGEGPVAPMMEQLKPAMIGLQVGSLVGSLSTWAMASFDAGIPPDRPGPLTIIVPNVDRLVDETSMDPKEVRLWVVANEVAFRSVANIPWIQDHLAVLVDRYADAVKIDPTKLSGLMLGGTDPGAVEAALAEAGGIDGLLGGEEAEAPRLELEAFLGALTGCSRLLARRGIAELSPDFNVISKRRDSLRERDAGESQALIGVSSVPAEATRLGDEFNQEVERRYGDDALQTLWADPTRMPTATELRDPTAWAARVLLDGWT